MVNQTTGAQDETIQFAISIESFDTIKQTGDYVVSARSLSTGKDNTYIHSRQFNSFSGFKLNQWHTVRIGK